MESQSPKPLWQLLGFQQTEEPVQPITTTARYNLLRGDNLDGLPRLACAKTLFDVCYIDPPYNTGSSFLYNDHRKQRLSTVFGSNEPWMQFMLPRLYWGAQCLQETGIMMVSIDDYAMAHLKLMLDDVFGEDNHLGTIAVRRSKNGKSAKQGVATGHEYVLVYRKSAQGKLLPLPDRSEYPKEDAYGRYRIDGLFRKKGDASLRTDRPNLFYPLYACLKTGSVSVEPKEGTVQIFPRDSRGTERRWIWSKETAAARSHCLYSSPNGVVYVKNYQSGQGAGKISSWWDDPAYYTERGTMELKAVFGEKIFDTPKPIAFIKQLLSIAGDKQARILDFFAGSGTTAIAAHQLNQADGGERSVVLMESNTNVPHSSKAFQEGFQTISDITLARLLGSGLEPHRVDDRQL